MSADARGASSAARTTLRLLPDRILAGRFKIIRFIACGGMGEVYEAEDLELCERVALKTVTPEIACEPLALERFKREIQLARRVTHPNVCRIFDVFHDRSPETELTFLTMELLNGETLYDYVQSRGRMSTDGALPLVLQMTAGLQTAHEAGVIHRDFKSSNVMLTVRAPREGSGSLRAVITDFGLARGDALRGGGSLSLSGGEIRGTPAYMAPEQLEGKEITTAADVYALGVVIYELSTGTGPFAAATPLATAVKRLVEPPIPPRVHVPDLDERWERVVLRCLERRPEERFSSAEEVARSLRGEPLAPKSKRGRRVAGVATFGALALLVGALGYDLVKENATSSESRAVARRSVAVLGFKNLAARDEARWLSTALSEMLAAELGVGQRLRTIPGENVARMRMDLALTDADAFGKETLARIREYLGVDVIVLGSYLALGKEGGGQIRLDVRIQDASSGETIATISEAGTEAALLDLVARGGARLRSHLGVAAPSAASETARSSLPSDPEAARLNAEGLSKLRAFDALGARDSLERAVAAAPDHPMPHAGLAAAWAALGYEEKAREEAKRALELSDDLSREGKLAVEAGYHEMSRDYEKAIETYSTLFRFFPDNVDYGLRLAAAQSAAGNGRDALATVSELRRLSPSGSSDPRVDLEEATASALVGDSERQRNAASRAAAQGELHGMRLLVARARLSEGVAQTALGEPQKALKAFKDAEQLFSSAGDKAGAARTLNQVASLLWQQGDLEATKQIHTQALSLARSIGNKAIMASALNNVGLVLMDQGRMSQAKSNFEQATAVQREVGNKASVIAGLNNLGGVLFLLGDLEAAQRAFEEGLALSREVGNDNNTGMALSNTAYVHMELGRLDRARAMIEEANVLLARTGNRGFLAYATSAAADLLFIEGDLEGAREKYREALSIGEETGKKGSALDHRLSLAQVDLEEGHLREAEAAARATIDAFRQENRVESEILAHVVLARSLVGQGRVVEAGAEVETARASGSRSPSRPLESRAPRDGTMMRGGPSKKRPPMPAGKAS